MEDLIEEFLEELIDKNEITANERTDMKLTLLEAMPREMTEETKIRVMSSLKSKMETPSANIFTDKGVNIDAVRTIANESVKEVVKAVEKEEQAKVEAEAKRDAKVSEAIDSIILDADKKDEVNKFEKEQNQSSDNYAGVFYNDLTEEDIEEAYNNASSWMNNKLTNEQLELASELMAKAKKMNARINEICKSKGVSREQATQEAMSEISDGNADIAEIMTDFNTKQIEIEVMNRLVEVMYGGNVAISFYEAIEMVKPQFIEKYDGLDFEKITRSIHDYFMLELGHTESFLRGEGYSVLDKTINDEFIFDIRIEAELLDMLNKGKTFSDSVKQIEKDYSIFMPQIKDFRGLIDNLRQKFLALGVTENELESGTISKDKIKFLQENSNNYRREDVEKNQPVYGPQPLHTRDEEQSQEESIKRPTYSSNRINITESDLKSICDRFARHTMATMIGKVRELENKHREDIDEARKKKKISIDDIAKSGKALYKEKIALFTENRRKNEEDYKKGNLNEEEKAAFIQRELQIKKAVKVFLSGEKTAHEIVRDLGDLATKYYILPHDIIIDATRIIGKDNKVLADQIKSSEETIVERYYYLDAAHIALEEAIKENRPFKIKKIKDQIKEIESEIEACKRNSVKGKDEYGSLDQNKAKNNENDIQKNIKLITDYNKQFEELKQLQLIYSDIQEISQNKGKTFNESALYYFTRKRFAAQTVGAELIQVLDGSPSGNQKIDFRKIVETSIQNANKAFMVAIENRLDNLDEQISKKENGIEDEGYTDNLVERDSMKRELKKAQDRDFMLENNTNIKPRRNMISIKKGLVEYFKQGVDVAAICSILEKKEFDVGIHEMLTGIVSVAKKAGIEDEKIKEIYASEMATYQDSIRLEGLKKLRKNAEKQSNEAAISELNEQINNIETMINARNEDVKEFKSKISDKFPNLEKNLGIVQNKDAKSRIGRKIDKPTTRMKLDRSKKSVNYSAKLINEQVSVEEQPKKGVGLMNVAKILETSGTTSQEIVGEVTDLNKFARVQDERGISEEQRDS